MNKYYIFIQKNYHKIFALLFSLTIIIYFGLIKQPELKGDGIEYYTMLESLYNHMSPEQREIDVISLHDNAESFNQGDYDVLVDKRYYLYNLETDNNYYPTHFWGYSLISLPSKYILSIFNQDEMKAYQLTNALTISALIIFFTFKIKLPKQKLYPLITLLLFFNPSVLYISWPHPELTTFVFIMFALLFHLKKQNNYPIFFASLAAMQNQPIIVFVIYFTIFALYKQFKQNKQASIKSYLLTGISLSPILINLLYNYLIFNNINPIIKLNYSNQNNLSINKAFELFFDLNIGVIPFAPVALAFGVIIFILALYKIFIKKDKSYKNFFILILLLITIIECYLSTSTMNWNSGLIGASRYSSWSVTPFILISIIWFYLNLHTSKPKFLLIFSILLITVTTNIILFSTTYYRQSNELYFTPISRVFLNYIPSIYNPSYEIFNDRVNFQQDIKLGAKIYKNGDTCKKALISSSESSQIEQTISECGKLGSLGICERGFCYYNF